MASSKSPKRSLSWLPSELLEEILFRISIESLVRFISICKQWYALINANRFTYKHLDLSPKRLIEVDPPKNSVQIFNPETNHLSCLQGPSDIFAMIHCDGLLLCRCESTKIGNIYRNLAVWNPFLRRFNWIELSCVYRPFEVYGFGYDNISRDNYKILRFCVEGRSDIEIYEFKSKLWRRIDAALDERVKLWHAIYQALSMNGNMYWIAHRKKGNNSETEIFIQSFDFSRETFKDIGCVVPFETDCFTLRRDSTLVLSGFGGDRLSLLHQHRRVKIEVWVTNKVTDGVVSWSKYFNVTRPDLPILHYSSYCSFPTYFIDHKTNNIMVWCGQLDVEKEYIYANVYEMGHGEIKKNMLWKEEMDAFIPYITIAMYILKVWFQFLNKRKRVHVTKHIL